MTLEQYERWKDFALRMAKATISLRRRAPSRATVIENIKDFFECRMEPDDWQWVQNWDHNHDNPADPDGRRYGMSVSSHIREMAEDWIPNYHGLSARAFERAESRWAGPAQCCIRAGLDVAVAPSAGVAGFTVADIRRMYPEGVPDWVKTFFEPTQEDKRTFDQLQDKEYVWL